MSGLKIDSVKTGKADYSPNLNQVLEKDKKVSIMDRGIISEEENGTGDMEAESSDMAAVCDVYSSISNVENTLKEMGCPALKGVANTITTKAKAVVSGIGDAVKAYDKELLAISRDTSLTDEEMKSKIELINAKKQAMIQEGEMKLSIMEKLSNSLLEMFPMFIMLKEMGANTNSLTETIKQLVQNISASPSSLKNVKDKEELKKTSNLNMKEIFGKDSVDEMKRAVDKIDKKIQDKEERDKDQFENYSDRVRYKEEVKVLKLQKKVLADVIKKLDSIVIDEKS